MHRDGTASSLKAGKVRRTITQLKTYRQFGAPEVTLVDVFICENGFMSKNRFPPDVLMDVVKEKLTELGFEGFGYQLLPFEHGKEDEADIGLIAIHSINNIMQTTFNILPSNNFGFRQPFSQLVDVINNFYDQQLSNLSKKRPKQIIIYCKNCRKFQLIDMKNEQNCPNCNENLVAQT